MLRAWDGVESGASRRIVAGILLNRNVEALRATHQDRVADLEDETGGYTDVSAFVGYKIPSFDDTEAMVYLRGDNLLDDEIVRHTSFLRVAQPGRSVVTGINVRF